MRAHPARGRDHNDREATFHHGNRPVQEVGGRERFRGDVRSLLQLQRGLPGGSEVVPSGGHDAAYHPLIPVSHLPHVGFLVERCLHQIRQGAVPFNETSLSRDLPDEQAEQRQLSRVGFRRGHAALGAGVQQQRRVGSPRQRRGPVVGDGDGECARGSGRGDIFHDVRGPSGLGKTDHQRAAHTRFRAVEGYDRRRRQAGRNAQQCFKEIVSVQRGVVGRASRRQDDRRGMAPAQVAGQPLDGAAFGIEDARQHLGLLADLRDGALTFHSGFPSPSRRFRPSPLHGDVRTEERYSS